MNFVKFKMSCHYNIVIITMSNKENSLNTTEEIFTEEDIDILIEFTKEELKLALKNRVINFKTTTKTGKKFKEHLLKKMKVESELTEDEKKLLQLTNNTKSELTESEKEIFIRNFENGLKEIEQMLKSEPETTSDKDVSYISELLKDYNDSLKNINSLVNIAKEICIEEIEEVCKTLKSYISKQDNNYYKDFANYSKYQNNLSKHILTLKQQAFVFYLAYKKQITLKQCADILISLAEQKSKQKVISPEDEKRLTEGIKTILSKMETKKGGGRKTKKHKKSRKTKIKNIRRRNRNNKRKTHKKNI